MNNTDWSEHIVAAKLALRDAEERASKGEISGAVEAARELETQAARFVIAIRQWQEQRRKLEGTC